MTQLNTHTDTNLLAGERLSSRFVSDRMAGTVPLGR